MADASAEETPKRHCENCGAVLLGDHCYSCGQPTKGLIRQFSAIIGDFADTVLNIDSRIIHTVGPLLFKPGHLSLEYFAGRRVRYVSPVRLLVFIAVVTFLFAQWLTPDFQATNNGAGPLTFDTDSNDFGDADSVAEVVKERDAALAGLDHAIKESAKVPGLDATLKAQKKMLRDASDLRIAELQGKGKPASAVTATAPAMPALPSAPAKEPEMNLNGKPWDPDKNPLTMSWLPASGNALLNKGIGRAKKNYLRIKGDPNLLKNAIFSTAPTTLFILVPVFALLLKILYLFKRRLYMEHVIVALHSHAFLCLNVLLLVITGNLQDWLAPTSGLLHSLFGFIEFALVAWMPIYLLLMQKRVYGQGWPMTLIKYSLLGFCYVFLLSFGMLGTLAAAFLWL